MVNHKRRKRLLKLLAEHRTATVQQFVEWLNASPATVRRDIGWLAARKLLTRTRGGAENLPPDRRQLALSGETFQDNIRCYVARKRAIARHAASMCVEGETVIINGGTTTFMMTEFLADKRLKILTNSFPMAARLLVSSENEITVPGGTVYREQNVILSPFDNDITQHHYASKMFTSVYGLSLLPFRQRKQKGFLVNQRYRPITRLGLGGTGLGDMYHTTTDEAAHATVDAAWDAGIRYFDTAPHYGAGLSEHRFGQALRRRPRDDYTLSTKVGRLLVPHMPARSRALRRRPAVQARDRLHGRRRAPRGRGQPAAPGARPHRHRLRARPLARHVRRLRPPVRHRGRPGGAFEAW
jgi:DeoR/GlpR family transcriptional regulator of sugar metabolism